MDNDHLVLAEDELADELLHRGRSVGRGWIVASGFALAVAIGLWSTTVTPAATAVATACSAAGLRVRHRYWCEATRQVGDAAMQRARWRSAGIAVPASRR